MTENKRFKEQNLENHLNRIYDTKKGKVVFDEDIVDLLNQLSEENQQIKNKGLTVLHFYEDKLKNAKKEDFQSIRDELWIVKQVLYEIGIDLE